MRKITITVDEGVALRKESVDRNAKWLCNALEYLVALRKESVDRNITLPPFMTSQKSSLSARRAWIEIRRCVLSGKCRWSLSARRAWIEMLAPRLVDMSFASLSARRAWIEMFF